MLRHLAALALQFRFDISAVYFPAFDNIIADTISRLHETGKLRLPSRLLKVTHKDVKPFLNETVKKICFHVDL